MSESQNAHRIFLSYGRGDDDAFVAWLYDFLTMHGFHVWWDRKSMPSRGLTILPEIRSAIDASDRVIAVLGPHAIRSDYVRKEWQYAHQGCKPITPLLRSGDYSCLPEEFQDLHCLDCLGGSGPD